MENELWTPNRVKDELPEVDVKVGKEIVKGQVGGRKLPFAGVWFSVNGVPLRGEYAWATIANALNKKQPLIY